MEDINYDQLQKAVDVLKKGGTIAYPTEAVYGFGCDPFNINPVSEILQIKNRSIDKGFILVAANWNQLENLVEYIEPKLLIKVLQTWPGPYTWVFPAKNSVPRWLTGKRNSIALRVSAHPLVQTLCQLYGGPILSTSANLEGQPPARDYRTVKLNFEKKVGFILSGKVGKQLKPTEIRDAITGEIIRLA